MHEGGWKHICNSNKSLARFHHHYTAYCIDSPKQAVSKYTKKQRHTSACVQVRTFIVLWQLQRVRWLLSPVPLEAADSCALCALSRPPGGVASSVFTVVACSSTSPTSIFSTRISYSEENQLVACKPEQLKGLPSLVGTTASQQHASTKSLTSIFAWGICELFAFSHYCTACSCCSEEGVYPSTSARCTVRPKVSLLASFSILHCISVVSNCFLLPNIVRIKKKVYAMNKGCYF